MLTTMIAIAVAVQVSAPVLVTTIDTGKLKGEPTQLGWSPDGSQFFLQTSERDGTGMTKNHRYYILSANGTAKAADAPPGWATEYWTWKSSQYAPGSTSFGIEIKKEERKLTATSAPMGGDLARGGVDTGTGGTTAADVAAARAQMQTVNVFTLLLKGETVGEFAGQQFLPGYTFGWSPKDQGMIAYANRAGRLAVMDQQGKKEEVESTKNVILPAWSPDGSKIAFLQKAGKNKYELFVANVTP
jgi:hypothetical protein